MDNIIDWLFTPFPSDQWLEGRPSILWCMPFLNGWGAAAILFLIWVMGLVAIRDMKDSEDRIFYGVLFSLGLVLVAFALPIVILALGLVLLWLLFCWLLKLNPNA